MTLDKEIQIGKKYILDNLQSQNLQVGDICDVTDNFSVPLTDDSNEAAVLCAPILGQAWDELLLEGYFEINYDDDHHCILTKKGFELLKSRK